MKRIVSATALAVCPLCLPAFSGTIFYSVTGIFPASGTPSSPLSADNTPFEFSFSLPDAPIPIFSNPATFGYNTPVTYKLGATVFAGSFVQAVGFFTSGSGGGMFLPFQNGADSINYNGHGPQLFTGPTNAPVLTPGVFPMTSGTLDVNGSLVFIAGTVTATAVPEPASFGLAGLALVMGTLVLSSRRHRSRNLFR